MVVIPRIDATSDAGRSQLQALQKLLRSGTLQSDSSTGSVQDVVAQLLAEVAAQGDDALVKHLERIDGVSLDLDALRVSSKELEDAHAKADSEMMGVFRRAAENIRAYQGHIKHCAPAPLVRGGRRLGVRYTPISRVGLYVPGGRAFYPSSLLMTAVPAQVAGVRSIALCSPPRGGDLHPMLLALAHELGITEVYRIGGASAVAAMAYGTERMARVDKIVGPGNAYVAEAKRQVFGRVGIDAVAGPSEVLVLADDSADPAFVAADLIAQAEHDPGSSILLSPSASLIDSVFRQLEQQTSQLERRDAIAASLAKYGALVETRGLDDAIAIANTFASEHVEVMTDDNERVLGELHQGGAIFVGPHTPVSLGDYYAGPSHVLPTGGSAAFFGPLSVNEFLKATSLIEYDAQSLEDDASDVEAFASHEGLTAHAAAVTIRRQIR